MAAPSGPLVALAPTGGQEHGCGLSVCLGTERGAAAFSEAETMSTAKKPTAIEKRAQNLKALAPFTLDHLRRKLPLVFPRDPELPPSPKPRYRSTYCYLGADDLNEETVAVFSPFEISTRLFDYSSLEPLLAAHIYMASAKGQVPFHPVSMYLLSLYRRERNLSRHEVLRVLRHPEEGQVLRRCAGFGELEQAGDDFPGESGLRYFEKQLAPELQQEINALQIEALYQASLLPTKLDAEEETKATLSFDGMLHQARSRLRCSSVKDGCYEAAPRPCPAREKGKQGCDCRDEDCAEACHYTTPRDPEARFIVYSGNKRAKTSPNTPVQPRNQRSRPGRMVYGFYSHAGQFLDDELATYWMLPAAFGPATCGDCSLFPTNFNYLETRFPWLKISEVIADAGIDKQGCLDLIWEADRRLYEAKAKGKDAVCSK